jgi:hypothetical protein
MKVTPPRFATRTIGVAIGIVMERAKVTRAAAFDVLVVASQTVNMKLVPLADELVATGQLSPKRRGG